MKKITKNSKAILILLLFGFIFGNLTTANAEARNKPKLCFSPEGHCQTLLISTIAQAQKSIRVQAYSFTAAPIAQALIDARQHGVDVAIVLDRSQPSEHYSVLPLLLEAAVPTKIDYCCAIAHNKVMIIDDRWVVTGSYNFTKSAEEKNAENLLVIDDPELAESYRHNWEHHWTNAKLATSP